MLFGTAITIGLYGETALSPAQLLLRGESAGFALSFEQAQSEALVIGHTTNFRGNPNDLLTYTSPSTKYVMNSSGVLVPGTTLRTDHLADGTALGLLIEEQRTNLLTYSEQFDNADWTKTDASVAANATTAPDGNSTADKLVEDSGAVVAPRFTQGPSITSGTEYTQSIYFKSAGDDRGLRLTVGGASFPTKSVFVNPDTGAVVSGTVNVEALVDGWYRADLQNTANATGGCTITVSLTDGANSTNVSYTGDGSSGIYIWGAQLEAGSFPLSYIKTEGSQVTRNAGNISLATTEFPFDAAEGTVIVEWNTPNSTFTVLGSEGSINNRLLLTHNNARMDSGSTTFSGVISPGSDSHKVAMAVNASRLAVSIDGAAASEITGTVLDGTVTNILFGNDPVQNNLNGWIKSFVYLPHDTANGNLPGLSA